MKKAGPLKKVENSTIMRNYNTLSVLNERAYKIQPIHNKQTQKFDENLLSVNDALCYILPTGVSIKVLPVNILENTDFLITSLLVDDTIEHYIIPSDFVIDNKEIEIQAYKNAWKFLEI